MPRKLGVGMPKRKKKKVQAAAAVATEPAAAPAAAVAEMPPPPSPKRRAAPSPARAPPPSPGAVKLKELEAAAAKAARVLRLTHSDEQKAEKAFILAVNLFGPKNNSIEKAGKRKRKPLSAWKALNKLWAAESEVKGAQLLLYQCMWRTAVDTVKLRDAQNAVLRAKLRRKSQSRRVRAWNPQGRGVVAARRLQHSLKVQVAASPVCSLLSDVTPESASSERIDLKTLDAQLKQYSDELVGWKRRGACDGRCALQLSLGRGPCIRCAIAPAPGMTARNRDD